MPNPVISAAIDADIATLERNVSVPTGPLGYGRDLSCVTDCTETFDEVDPQSPLAIAQALMRELTTEHGTLPDDPNYGYNVRAALNHGVTLASLQALSDRIKTQVARDDRVSSAECALNYDQSTKRLRVTLDIVPTDARTHDFAFVFAVDATGEALIESIS